MGTTTTCAHWTASWLLKKRAEVARPDQADRDRMPAADLHTSDELLAVAASLLASGEPTVRRAAVLEAITALEAYVERTVLGLVDVMFDPLLAKWIAERTRMDFDSRLRVVAPVVLGREVDTSSDLWAEYRRAKQIRNRVTHSGARVSHADAAFVVETVRKWLGYLGSSADVALALQGLKDHIERTGMAIPDARTAAWIVADYFRGAAAIVRMEVDSGTRRPDLVLKFGDETVVVEVKVVPAAVTRLEPWIAGAAEQVASYAQVSGMARAAVVLFARRTPTEAYRTVRVRDASISIVVIEAPSEHGKA